MIEIKLEKTSVFSGWPCTVCGGWTERDNIQIQCEGGGVRVCPECLRAGNIDVRLEAQAAELAAQAAGLEDDLAELRLAVERDALFLRSLVGQLIVPTYEQWEAAEEAARRLVS